jgi:hypothetical protein
MLISNCKRICGNRAWIPLIVIGIMVLLSGCDSQSDAVANTPIVARETLESQVSLAAASTWTPVPVLVDDVPDPTEPPPPTSTPLPTSTAVPPTDTPEASPTPTVEASSTPLPPTEPPPTQPAPTSPPAAAEPEQPAASPVPPPAEEPAQASEPVLGINLLPNPSFEEGHYNQNGIAELQLPNQWRLEWDEGPTGVGNAKWDYYVRPEARVLSTAFLPAEEHPLYIYDGQNTVKIFKGSGAVSFRLLTDITLEPGTYVIEAKMFADIVEKWEDRTKQWALDPTAAEFRFIVGDGGTVWTQQRYGQINVHNFTFTIDQTKTIPIGIWLRGKYAIANNGWFIDDLSVRRVE